jgi:hypothetical protein
MLTSVRFVIFILRNGSIGLSDKEEGDTPGPNSCREVDIDGRCCGLAPVMDVGMESADDSSPSSRLFAPIYFGWIVVGKLPKALSRNSLIFQSHTHRLFSLFANAPVPPPAHGLETVQSAHILMVKLSEVPRSLNKTGVSNNWGA